MEWLKRIWFGKAAFAGPSDHNKTFSGITCWDEEGKLMAALENMNIGAALVASHGQFLRVNDSLCNMLGYSSEEMLKTTLQDIAYGDETNEWSQRYNLLSKSTNSINIEKSYQHKLGHLVWVKLTLTPIRNSQEKDLSFFSQFQNISKYKQAEDSFQQGKLLLQGIIEGIPDAVYVKDLFGRYLIVNSIAAKLHGKKTEDIIGKCDSDVFPVEDIQTAIEIDRQVIENRESTTYELALTIDGMTRAILFTKTPYLDQTGKSIGVVVVARDITDHQRAAENLENSRAELRALSARLQSVREEERLRIAREIHDELGQVLTGLKLDLVSFTKKVLETKNRDSEILLKGKAREILNLINNAILTVRKISTELRPGLLDAVGLTAAIEWQAKEFENRTGVRCKLKLPHENIVLDQYRSIAVFRIFQEILTNVARHSKATEVTITIEKIDFGLSLEAKDNGRGIRANEFSNPKSLGLLGMRERALLLGGEVIIRGVPNKGTTVTLRIPFDHKNNTHHA